LEVLFAHTYLILFGKLAAGGLLALAVPPFFEVERGFYKSTAAVYVALAYVMAAGDAYLLATYGESRNVNLVTVLSWAIFSAFSTAYLVTLFLDLPRARARLYPAAIATGFAALGLTGWSYVPENMGFLAGVPYAASMWVGAAVSGGAVTGMLLGHWYLIETGLDLLPLERMLAFCQVCLGTQLVVVPLAALTLWLQPSPVLDHAFAAAFGAQLSLIIGRAATWALALVLLTLIARTLAIPQTMAATGLFYIQALTIAVGEIFSHWLLFRTGLPL
jgi:hypothetical protein